MRTQLVALAVVVLFSCSALWMDVLPHPYYSSDGTAYARFAGRDAGWNNRDIARAVRSLYAQSSLMPSKYRAGVELDPAVAFRNRIFRTRILYSWLASILLPFTGLRALFIVSAVSYVAFGIALFWMLSSLGRPGIGAAITITALAIPYTRHFASADLTDMLAAVWWALAIGILLRLLRKDSQPLLIALAVTSALLALTRPTAYMTIIPAFVPLFTRRAWLPLLAACTGGVAFAIAVVLTRGYSVGEQLQWIFVRYRKAPNESFIRWYVLGVFGCVRYLVSRAIHTVFPIFLIGAAVYDALTERMRDETLVLLAAGVACLVPVFLNPLDWSMTRVVVFPLLPVFCAMAQSFANVLLDRNYESLGLRTRDTVA